MSGPFKVGDVVVRVADPRLTGGNLPPPKHLPLRVEFVEYDCSGDQGVGFERYPSNHPRKAWGYWNFRHLPKADERFTAKILACRPIKRSVDA